MFWSAKKVGRVRFRVLARGAGSGELGGSIVSIKASVTSLQRLTRFDTVEMSIDGDVACLFVRREDDIDSLG